MKQAIIHLQGKFFKVSEGDSIKVDRIATVDGQKQIEVEQINLISNDNNSKIGKPYIENAKAVLEVIEESLGKKVIARTFHRRKRYTKTKGHRQKQTKLIVKSINFS